MAKHRARTLYFVYSEFLIYDKCYIICTDIREKIVPGVTHWQSPNYFAYYPSNSSTAGFLGEMLSAAFNIVGFSWITSPAATELEVIVLDWFAKMLRLPSQFLSTGKCSITFGFNDACYLKCLVISTQNISWFSF